MSIKFLDPNTKKLGDRDRDRDVKTMSSINARKSERYQ